MSKYKFRATIYGTFLIVSLIVIGILFYYIFELEDKNTTNYDELSLKLTNIYESAYIYINSNKDIDNDECMIVNIEEYEKYFSENVIAKLKNNLIYENNIYYDCNNYIEKVRSDTIFTKNGMGTIEVKYVDEVSTYAIYSFNGEVKNIIFKKIDGDWYIDLF